MNQVTDPKNQEEPDVLSRRRFLRWTLIAPACAASYGCTTSGFNSANVSTANLTNGSGNATNRNQPRKPRPKRTTPQPAPPTARVPEVGAKLKLDDAQWRERLSDLQYKILREADTEPPWTGAYLKEKTPGIYHCAACNNPLFASSTKFNSKTGWPSFWQPVQKERISTRPDPRHEQMRTEVLCAHCDGHLGHVFEDGPKPTGLRYCVNSVALYLRPSQSATDRPTP